MFQYTEIGIDVITDKDATAVSVVFDGKRYTASSKRNPRDKYDEEIGIDLAVARLFGKISRDLARRADGAVKHAGDVAADRRRRNRSAVPYRISVRGLVEGLAEQVEQQSRGRHEKPFDWRARLLEMMEEEDRAARRR